MQEPDVHLQRIPGAALLERAAPESCAGYLRGMPVPVRTAARRFNARGLLAALRRGAEGHARPTVRRDGRTGGGWRLRVSGTATRREGQQPEGGQWYWVSNSRASRSTAHSPRMTLWVRMVRPLGPLWVTSSLRGPRMKR